MAGNIRVLYYLNQFFAGLGGEEQAHLPPQLLEGARGPGILFEKLAPGVDVVATVVCGDNYFAEKTEQAVSALLELIRPLLKGERESILIAGPAFNAGRYGLACGAICRAVQDCFALPAVTSMYPENPAVEEYRKNVLIARAGQDVLAMEESVKNMVHLAGKILRDEELRPDRDDYIPQGRRKNYFAEQSGAVRAVDMLLKKLAGKPFTTEYVMPVFERVSPAPAVSEITKARLALVTSGGIVPLGNPDRIEAANASRFGAYSLKGLSSLSAESHQSVHGGYDPTFANADPNRVLPLDVVRELETEGAFGELHHTYYATVGNGTSVANAEKYGREIAKRLLADGVQAVILTST